MTVLGIYAHDKQLEPSCRKMSKLARYVERSYLRCIDGKRRHGGNKDGEDDERVHGGLKIVIEKGR